MSETPKGLFYIPRFLDPDHAAILGELIEDTLLNHGNNQYMHFGALPPVLRPIVDRIKATVKYYAENDGPLLLLPDSSLDLNVSDSGRPVKPDTKCMVELPYLETACAHELRQGKRRKLSSPNGTASNEPTSVETSSAGDHVWYMREPLFDQVIVNRYLVGQGIKAHIDLPKFDDGIVGLSFHSSCVMEFRPVAINDDRVYQVLLNPGDMYVMSGAARYEWTHCISDSPTEKFGERIIERGMRVSVTLRKVLFDDNGIVMSKGRQKSDFRAGKLGARTCHSRRLNETIASCGGAEAREGERNK